MSRPVRRLAGVIRRAAVRSTVAAPSARGADWQRVTVTAVNGDGTCAVQRADGSTIANVRRSGNYSLPEVGDLAIMHRNGSGNRLLEAPLATDPGSWQTAVLGSNWSVDPSTPLVQYRHFGANVQMRGSAQCGTFHANGGSTMVICTLPAGYQPVQLVSLPASNPGLHGSMWEVQVATSGAITALLPTAPSALFVSLDNVIFPTT